MSLLQRERIAGATLGSAITGAAVGGDVAAAVASLWSQWRAVQASDPTMTVCHVKISRRYHS